MSLLSQATLLTLVFLLVSLFLSACDGESETLQTVIPKTVQPMNADVVAKNRRLTDLGAIAIALEKFKQEHRTYPLSSGFGSEWYEKKWDSAIEESGKLNHEWILGLAPKYISHLPIDPRRDGVLEHQYVYKSDGANYKLVALNPEDCVVVKQEAPEFIDLRRGKCKAYGFWTLHAFKWR